MTPNAEQLKDLIKKFEAKGYELPDFLALLLFPSEANYDTSVNFTKYAHLILADIQKWCRGRKVRVYVRQSAQGIFTYEYYYSYPKPNDGDWRWEREGCVLSFYTYKQALYEALKEVDKQGLV